MIDLNQIRVKKKWVNTKDLFRYLNDLILKTADAKDQRELDMNVGSVIAILAIITGEDSVKEEDASKLKDAVYALSYMKHREFVNEQ